MPTRRMLAVLFAAAAIGVAACGGDDGDDAAPATTTTVAQEAPAEAAPPAASPTTVATASTDAGDALVDAEGLTLYGFLPDDGALEPTCVDACADTWPPLVVDGDALPAGLDPAVFSVIARADGSSQLVAGKWPLYRFAGDTAPGDASGQGTGGNWFVVAPDGGLIR